MATKRSRHLLFFVGAAFLMLTTTGCQNKNAQKTAGEGMVAVGSVMVTIPITPVKVIGAVLISAGTALIVEAELADGSRHEYQFELTDEAKKSLKEGGQVEVRDSNGKTTLV